MFIYFQILKKQEIAVWQLDTTISQMLSNEMFYICISWIERTNALINFLLFGFSFDRCFSIGSNSRRNSIAKFEMFLY